MLVTPGRIFLRQAGDVCSPSSAIVCRRVLWQIASDNGSFTMQLEPASITVRFGKRNNSAGKGPVI